VKPGHFIDGQWVHAAGGRMMTVDDPSSGQIIAQVPAGGRAEAEHALEAARRAAKAWAEIPAGKRASYLLNVVKLLRERVDSFADTIMAEQGKPLTQARGEVMGAALQLEYHAQWAGRIESDALNSDSPGEQILILRVPYGVVVALVPWNYPLSLTARKVAPALMAGNTVVVKPHEITPLSALRFEYRSRHSDGQRSCRPRSHAPRRRPHHSSIAGIGRQGPRSSVPPRTMPDAPAHSPK
jgi:lactaldehyde dehydrogenase/glycolaldehyde dehydrogenase